MKLITHDDYLRKVELHDYFKNRWSYYSIIIEEIKKLEPKFPVLEVGSSGLPMVSDCVTMDVTDTFSPSVLHDATNTPWPFATKQFDLCIALQTWEHLGDKQTQAFDEVVRTSKRAILSFPYKWKLCDKNDIHYNLDESIFDKWTLQLPHKKVFLQGHTKGYDRMAYVFDHL